MLLGALDTYVVVTIMVDIMRSVGIPVNKLQQVTPIITGYLLGYIAAMPLLGRLSDRFGRKLVLQVSLVAFAVGSVVTALSNDLTMLVIGRLIQGIASGALLPVTLALAADLWAARSRAAVLGGIGAAQELGSVLGPLYGIGVVWAAQHLAGRVLDQRAADPDRDGADPLQPAGHEHRPKRERVDVVGGLLLALALGLAVSGLYNPAPDGKQVLPSYGVPLIVGAVVAAVAFAVWERFARTRLIEPAGVRFGPFLAVAGHLDVRGRGADGHPGQRRTVRPGRAGQGPERGGIPAAALPGRAAGRRAARRLARHQDRRPGRWRRPAC